MTNYDHWKTTNPLDEELGPEPDDELPADWPPLDDDPKNMTGEPDE